MSTFPTLAATALGGANRLATELAPGGTYRADFSDTPWWLTLIKALLVFVYLRREYRDALDDGAQGRTAARAPRKTRIWDEEDG